jgi:hypothetical protein
MDVRTVAFRVLSSIALAGLGGAIANGQAVNGVAAGIFAAVTLVLEFALKPKKA